MITKVLDSIITINGKTLNILNTSSEIVVDWDVEIEKKEATAHIVFLVKSVKGNFEYSENKSTYKKNTSISFVTDDSWKITNKINDVADIILIPIIAKIDLDNKNIQIQF